MGGAGGGGRAGGNEQLSGHVKVKISTSDAPPQVSDVFASHFVPQLAAGTGPEQSAGSVSVLL